MLIGAIAAAALAAVLFLISRNQAGKAADIASTKTSKASELSELAAKVAAEIGAGSFGEYAEIKGGAGSDSPLRADFSDTACVWYECVATREYEEEYWEDDSEGRRQRKTRRGSEEVSRMLRDPPFYLDDGSGRIRVEPEGASIEPERSFSRFEPGEASGALRVGSFSLSLAMGLGAGRRTLGYRFEERCIPVGRAIYAIGQVSDAGGTLALRKPDEKGKRFILSVRGEDAILAGAKKAGLWLRIGAGASAAAAAGLAAAGLLGA